MNRNKLETAYLNTTYCVDHPGGGFNISIGETCAQLEALLHEYGVSTWVFVTAYNPRSQTLSPDENAARHAKLLAHVQAFGLKVLSGRGKAKHGDWVEESLLILGLDERAAVVLGTAFEQNAVVVGRVGGVAELKWCST